MNFLDLREVRTPSNARAEIQAKVREYLGAGGRAVVLLDPPTRSAEVVRSLTDRRVSGPDEILDLSDMVLGFACWVAEIFG